MHVYEGQRARILLEKFFKAVGIKSILAGVDTNRDTFRVNNCVTCANVYRAKGNEAPMVYIANSEYCADGAELSKLRNILFTSITRSRAWVRICGVGEEMQQIQREYEQCADNDYNLCFKVPTPKELEAARKLNRERTSTEKKILKTSKDNINELIDEKRIIKRVLDKGLEIDNDDGEKCKDLCCWSQRNGRFCYRS